MIGPVDILDCLAQKVQISDPHLVVIPGISPLSALALTAIFRLGTYRNADAFIAFIGMNVRVRHSGRWNGKSKLTKKGDPEVRRLLFNPAMRARRNPLWEPGYLALRERGFSTTAAFVAPGDRLAWVTFALLRKEFDFDHCPGPGSPDFSIRRQRNSGQLPSPVCGTAIVGYAA